MLANRVGVIPGAAATTWNDFPTTCHFATTFWLFWDEFGVPPTVNDYRTMGSPTEVVEAMLPRGAKITRPSGGTLELTPGTVLVFIDKDDHPKHSCVALDAKKVGGYNQPNWFASEGVSCGYSTHPTTDLRWRGGSNKPEVQGNSPNNPWCGLVAVPEGVAKAIVRKAIQG
jgi:hypothetical protein